MTGRGVRVLVAPDKFKGSLAAVGVAEAVARGIRAGCDAADVALLPVADGGDGTLAAAVTAGFERVPARVSGPTGEPVDTAYARRGSTAVLEMADACGLGRLPQAVPDALGASSRGLGELMAAALDAGCRELVIGIGGSASTDGGAGMVAALGASLLGPQGQPVPDGGGALSGIARLDLSDLHAGLDDARVVVASDVDNPLTGERGAASVYAPQKGADANAVARLDVGLAHWADVVAQATPDHADRRNARGAGAAGGVGFAALAVLGARLEPGIDLMLDLLAFDEAVTGCDLVVTGEGSLDAQSLHGKAPVGVAARARAHGVPVVAVCGRRQLTDDELRAAGIVDAHALTDLEPDIERCISDPEPLLERLGQHIAERRLT